MFRSLIANLPFSPGLLPQLSFYAKRLAQEDVTRKMGVMFAVLTLVVQGMLTFSPPTPSLASSDNDVIFGGLGTDTAEAKQKLIKAVYRGDGSITSPYSGKTHHDLDKLFQHFDISENDIRNATRVKICSSCTEQDKRKRSVGRLHNSRDASQDIPLSVAGSNEQYYLRPLHIWDIQNPHNYYDALKVREGVWIMLNCGNIVVENVPNPQVNVEKQQTPADNGTVTGGDDVTYNIDVKNTGKGIAQDVRVYDELPDRDHWRNFQTSGATLEDRDLDGDGTDEEVLKWKLGALDPGEAKRLTFTASLRSDRTFETNQQHCNTAVVTYGTATLGDKTARSNETCVSLKTPLTPEPMAYECTYLKADTTEGVAPLNVQFTAQGKDTVSNTEFKHYLFTIDGEETRESQSGRLEWTFTDLGEHRVVVQVVTEDGTTKITKNSPCAATVDVTPEPHESVEENKVAHVITDYNPVQTDDDDPRSTDVNGGEVKSSELIRYQLRVTNTGNVTYDSNSPYPVPAEDMVDVLEYANVIDKDGQVISDTSSYHEPIELFGGGVLDDGKITWEPVTDFAPGATIEKEIYVQTKDMIPATNTPPSDPFSYDCVMSNTFVNSETINIPVDCPAEKDVEQTVSTLPNTGPGEVAMATVFFGGLSFYLHSRNRQLMKELRIVQREHNGGLTP